MCYRIYDRRFIAVVMTHFLNIIKRQYDHPYDISTILFNNLKRSDQLLIQFWSKFEVSSEQIKL